MAYRKYNTYYKKKYGYRKKKFTKFNLYKNRSSKSQAYQIYNLNKKINMIEKKTKPEIKPDFINVFNLSNLTPAANAVLKRTYNFDFSSVIKGNLLRLQNICLYGNFNAYDNNSSDTTTYTTYLRLIIVQAKTGGQAPPTELLQNYNDMTFTRSPLCQGFSQTVKLIYDKLYYITNDRNSRNIKVNLKKRLDNIRRRLVDNSDPANPVYEYDGNLYAYAYIGNTNGSKITFNLNSKIMYVDED